MAFLTTFGSLAAVLLLLLVAVAFGTRVLQMLGLRAANPLEQALFAAGISFGALQVIVLVLAAIGMLQRDIFLTLVLAMAVVAGNRGWRQIVELERFARLSIARVRNSRSLSTCVLAILALLILDGLISMAPLTGSDALHYHFTVPSIWVHHGFSPVFGTTLSFAVGQAHMLILFGLTLGSDHIAMGLIFLGGMFAAGALFILAREWMSVEWSMAVTLSFLLAPIVFWQMTVAGAPDIWMTFYTTLAVLAAARSIPLRSVRLAVLAGFFAGAAAGSKFTAWAIPAALVLILLVESRSLWPSAASAFASLFAGMGPLFRNFLWTGDPFFPFLTRSLTPHNVNSYAIASVLADTRPVASHGSVISWAAYPFLLVLQGQKYGLGQYFGPLVLVFAPLVILAYRPSPLFRIAACVWGGMFLSNTDPPQMARFLLPVFGVALAVTFAGAETASRTGPRFLRIACSASIAVFLLFGAVSYGIYAKNFLPVSMGLEAREHFLARVSPNFQEVSFINCSLAGQPGTALVFFRYVYYLQVNYVQGNPEYSWDVDPEKLQTAAAMLDWLRKSGVRWIVKTGEYPALLRRPLEELQTQGVFEPVASTQAEDFDGFRFEDKKMRIKVLILELRPAKP
jgi:hypothetical protein